MECTVLALDMQLSSYWAPMGVCQQGLVTPGASRVEAGDTFGIQLCKDCCVLRYNTAAQTGSFGILKSFVRYLPRPGRGEQEQVP